MTDSLAGRYELGETLGSGGVGVVRKGWDSRLSRPVAVKVLRPGILDQEAHRLRLFSEARTAGALQHPGIAAVYDAGEDDGVAYLVMEYVDGESLADVLKRGPMQESAVRRLLLGVAEPLGVAHAAGVVHRDLKPGNIMIRSDGSPVLVDFGIARTQSSEALTITGTVIGTADYLSPEQARGDRATARSDLYSLGIVAHECLTGEKPFRRDNPVATALAQVRDPLPSLPASVSPGLAALIAQLCAKDPADRPADAGAVLAALSGSPASQDRYEPRTARLPATAVLPADPTPAASRGAWSGSPRWQHALLAVGVLVLLAALIALFSMRKDPASPNPEVPTSTVSSPSGAGTAPSGSPSSASTSPSATAQQPAPQPKPHKGPGKSHKSHGKPHKKK